jgi:hypothetical protein
LRWVREYDYGSGLRRGTSGRDGEIPPAAGQAEGLASRVAGQKRWPARSTVRIGGDGVQWKRRCGKFTSRKYNHFITLCNLPNTSIASQTISSHPTKHQRIALI